MDDEQIPAGEPLTLERSIEHLQGDDLGLRFYAAWWIGKFRIADPIATELLIAALDDTDDRTPEGGYPLRRNAARALGKIQATAAVPGLIAALDCSDYYVREAAAQSLEMLKSASSIEPLRSALARGLTQAAPALKPVLKPEQPDLSEPYDAYLEALGSIEVAGSIATIDLLKPFLQHPTARIQYSASRSLYQLTGEAQYGETLVQAVKGDDLQLRRAALADLGAIGYFPAASAIAQTLAENSLKLISLKGLLEFQLTRSPQVLNPEAIEVMNWMDILL